MDDAGLDFKADARAAAYATPLADINLGDPELFRSNTWEPFFERVRNEDPVHWTRSVRYGDFWSITKYEHILEIDTNPSRESTEYSFYLYDYCRPSFNYQRNDFFGTSRAGQLLPIQPATFSVPSTSENFKRP